jgi:hypothetical protein
MVKVAVPVRDEIVSGDVPDLDLGGVECDGIRDDGTVVSG